MSYDAADLRATIADDFARLSVFTFEGAAFLVFYQAAETVCETLRVGDVTLKFSEWAAMPGVTVCERTIRDRVKRRWDPQRAVYEPPKERRKSKPWGSRRR